jgi:hypothetical protein
MKYFYLEPEVAGGEGDDTEADRSVHPPVVTKLHYQFDGWLGDVLLEAFPCWIVTTAAAERIKEAGLTGVRFDEVQVTTSEEFEEIFPDVKLPEFVWLKVESTAGRSDFGVAQNLILVVSERALKLLQGLGIAHADVEPFNG